MAPERKTRKSQGQAAAQRLRHGVEIALAVAAPVNRELLPAGCRRACEEHRLALLAGVLGGFTTFSAFALEALTLVQRGHTGRAAAYVAASNILGLAACWAGWRLASLWAAPPAHAA